MEEMWQVSELSIKKAMGECPAEIAQFVLMANHYHLVIRTPGSDIDRFMYFFNKKFSETLREKTRLENRMFGGRYKWSLIESQEYLLNVYRYVYQNPLRANIVNKCEQYPYSTLYYKLKKIPWFVNLSAPFPMDEAVLQFINEKIEEKNRTSIQKGLRKTVFKEVASRR